VSQNSPTPTPDPTHFLEPHSRYYGDFSPEHLAFNANLQEFAQQVGVICALETGGKLPPGQAYDRIKQLWKVLRNSKHNLLDAENRPSPPELPPS
jgi:hypothetical protein